MEKNNKKIYVITGSTSGIGLELTKEFAKENIVFAGFRNNDFEKNLKEISENVIPFYMDCTDFTSIKSAIEFIKSKTNKIDTLINVAGCVVAGAMEVISTEELKRQFDVNVFSALEFSRGLLNELENGKILNVSSMSSFGIFPFIAPYCASKRTLDILFNLMQLEFKRNIKIVSLKLGSVATHIWSKSIKSNKQTFDKCSEYTFEMDFLVSNAMKNETKGIPIEKIVNKIVKIDSKQNPNVSYTIGFDAKCAEIFSHLPQQIINNIVGYRLKNIRKTCVH